AERDAAVAGAEAMERQLQECRALVLADQGVLTDAPALAVRERMRAERAEAERDELTAFLTATQELHDAAVERGRANSAAWKNERDASERRVAALVDLLRELDRLTRE